MSTISSWMRRRSRERLALTFLFCSLTGSSVLADVGTVGLGAHFLDAEGQPMQRLETVVDVQRRLASDMQQVITGFNDCAELIAGPLSDGTPADSLRDTQTVIQTIRVECWALSQLPPGTRVAAALPSDGITASMMDTIMAHAVRLASENDDWAKTLMRFSGGEIFCEDGERCRMSRSDGRDPPEQSLEFELIMAAGDQRFVMVTQMVYGRSGFVYGVVLREAAGKAQVARIFPDPA